MKTVKDVLNCPRGKDHQVEEAQKVRVVGRCRSKGRSREKTQGMEERNLTLSCLPNYQTGRPPTKREIIGFFAYEGKDGPSGSTCNFWAFKQTEGQAGSNTLERRQKSRMAWEAQFPPKNQKTKREVSTTTMDGGKIKLMQKGCVRKSQSSEGNFWVRRIWSRLHFCHTFPKRRGLSHGRGKELQGHN